MSAQEPQALPTSELDIRREVRSEDRHAIRQMLDDSGLFRPAEIDIAVELADERLTRGPASGYEFLFAESAGQTLGYACYGPIPCTVGNFDLYWIAVAPRLQRRGVGRRLLVEVEATLRAQGARGLYIETSGRPDYVATRGFYETQGYQCVATLDDFYAPGDDKVVFRKLL